MVEPLWTWADLVAATGGAAEGEAAGGVTGVSIDTRALQPGDLFVALRGDNQDGHTYVMKAFKKGAAAALVSADYVTPAGAGPLIRVTDQGGDPKAEPVLVALGKLGVAARARLSDEARVIAVTGSVGKTSTKEMLRVCLWSVDPRTHASEKSYNNHWGVPLTLARMPKDTRYGVFEIGMNHAGEITPLTKMVRPHVAIITTVGPVHLGHFNSVEEIADAKAEIFAGLEPGGVAVLPADNDYYSQLAEAARSVGAHLRTFGSLNQPLDFDFDGGVSPGAPGWRTVVARGLSGEARVRIINQRAAFQADISALHQVLNGVAALGACWCVGADVAVAARALSKFEPAEGRGAVLRYTGRGKPILLMDESYNANPLSMRAALVALSRRGQIGGRCVAVLGDMRELGEASDRLHAELGPLVKDNCDVAFLCGQHMRVLRDRLKAETAIPVTWVEKSTDLIEPLRAAIQPGDVIMVKGSLGTNMKPIVDALKVDLAGRAGEAKQ